LLFLGDLPPWLLYGFTLFFGLFGNWLAWGLFGVALVRFAGCLG